jgi:alpha-methylacyl-CoA racemase
MTDDILPLTGVRVVDMTRLLPGNFATLAMALLGADVIKVEDTGPGDYIRHYGTQVDGAGAVHHLANRGKRSITLDLKSDADRAVFESLVRTSQVLLESYRPGVLARLGYPPERLHELRPDLVIASISGYGATGPMAQKPGHDLNFLAFSGLLHRLGEKDQPPVVPPIPLADLLGGLIPALMVLAYIRKAEATGVGAVIDVAMAETVALLPTSLIAEILAGAPVGGRGDFKLGRGLASYGVYPTSDGWITVVAQEERFWAALCDVAGLADYRDRRTDPGAQAGIRARLSEFFAPLTRAEVEKLFDGHDGCVSPVLSYEEMLESPQAQARGYLGEADGLPIPALTFPAVVDGRRLPERGPAPRQGEHSDEIRNELTGDQGA